MSQTNRHLDNIQTDFDNPELPARERERALHRTVRSLIDWAREAHDNKQIDDKTYSELIAVLEFIRIGKLFWRIARSVFPLFVAVAFLISKRDAVERFIVELFK